MELNQKIKQLRLEAGWTQEELAQQLFVSWTVVSKWESGRGYPSIDSLKELSVLFNISLDDLLSNKELLNFAQKDLKEKKRKSRKQLFFLLDLLVVGFFFLPLFGNDLGTRVAHVSLLNLTETPVIQRGIIVVSVIFIFLYNLFAFYLMGRNSKFNEKYLIIFSSICLLIFTTLMIAMRQPYAASFLLMLLAIKVFLLIYPRWHDTSPGCEH